MVISIKSVLITEAALRCCATTWHVLSFSLIKSQWLFIADQYKMPAAFSSGKLCGVRNPADFIRFGAHVAEAGMYVKGLRPQYGGFLTDEPVYV